MDRCQQRKDDDDNYRNKSEVEEFFNEHYKGDSENVKKVINNVDKNSVVQQTSNNHEGNDGEGFAESYEASNDLSNHDVVDSFDQQSTEHEKCVGTKNKDYASTEGSCTNFTKPPPPTTHEEERGSKISETAEGSLSDSHTTEDKSSPTIIENESITGISLEEITLSSPKGHTSEVQDEKSDKNQNEDESTNASEIVEKDSVGPRGEENKKEDIEETEVGKSKIDSGRSQEERCERNSKERPNRGGGKGDFDTSSETERKERREKKKKIMMGVDHGCEGMKETIRVDEDASEEKKHAISLSITDSVGAIEIQDDTLMRASLPETQPLELTLNRSGVHSTADDDENDENSHEPNNAQSCDDDIELNTNRGTQQQPHIGAVAVRGRAFGDYPEWGRGGQNRLNNLTSEVQVHSSRSSINTDVECHSVLQAIEINNAEAVLVTPSSELVNDSAEDCEINSMGRRLSFTSPSGEAHTGGGLSWWGSRRNRQLTRTSSSSSLVMATRVEDYCFFSPHMKRRRIIFLFIGCTFLSIVVGISSAVIFLAFKSDGDEKKDSELGSLPHSPRSDHPSEDPYSSPRSDRPSEDPAVAQPTPSPVALPFLTFVPPSLCDYNNSTSFSESQLTLFEDIKKSLIERNISKQQDLEEPCTAQNQALTWLVFYDGSRNTFMSLTQPTVPEEKHNEDNDAEQMDQLTQRYIFVVFYFSTNGGGWYDRGDWLSDDHECHWKGVQCFMSLASSPSSRDTGNQIGIVKVLVMAQNNLVGVLPDEVQHLVNLTSINLSKNDELKGSISSVMIGSLTNLAVIDLYRTGITGSIPTQVGALSRLRDLDLGNTYINGTIPTEIGMLTLLARLRLNSMKYLNGAIPTEIGLLSQLEKINIQKSNIGGSIPSEIGELQSINELRLYGNQINGPIPSEIGFLSDIEILDCSRNKLEGTVPSEFGLLSNLERLRLDNNTLNGTIPSELANMNSLETLWLPFNKLTGTIPLELYNLTKLENLGLQGNQLKGTVPEDFCQFFFYNSDAKMCAIQNVTCSCCVAGPCNLRW